MQVVGFAITPLAGAVAHGIRLPGEVVTTVPNGMVTRKMPE